MNDLDEDVGDHVVGAARQQLVEAIVELLDAEQLGLLFLLGKERVHLVEVLVRHHGHGGRQDTRGDIGADLHHVLQHGAAELRDRSAAVGLDVYEPLRLKLTERLAHGNVADVQRGGDLVLLELHAAGQSAADDALPQDLIDPFLCSADARADGSGQILVIHHTSPHVRFVLYRRESVHFYITNIS